MKYKNFCEKLIELVGGRNNVEAVANCMTRLRFTLKDRSLAKTKEISELSEVIDVVSNEVAYQVIIGTQVSEICPELQAMLGLSGDTKATSSDQKLVTRLLNILSESMSPVVVPIMAAGLLAGIFSLISLTGIMSVESPTYQLFESIRISVFYFLPVFLAMSFSKKIGVNEYLAVTIAVTLLSTGINGVDGLSIFGFNLPMITYSNSFFPIILSVVFMKYAGKVLEKIVPKALQYFFNPALLLIVTLPITLIAFGPLGTWIGDILNLVFQFISNTLGNWAVVMLYAACQPFLITLGAGNFIIPIYMNSYATLGYDPVFTAAWIISDIAVCGAVLGYFFRAKDSKQKQLFGTTAFSAFMGITEPAMYGVFVKYRRPCLAVMIGGGLGGLFAGLMNVVSYAPITLFGLATYIGDGNYNNFYFMLASVIIGFVGSTIASYILGIPKEKDEEENLEIKNINKTFEKLEIQSPVKGQVVSLSEVNDKAFASGALGKGIAVVPEENIIHSPVEGEVVSLFPTNHAIGLKTHYGVEVLIHIGINTVELDGKYFKSFVKQGDKVTKGQDLIQADFEKIKVEGFDPTTIVIITNTADYLDILPTQEKIFTGNENCLTVVV